MDATKHMVIIKNKFKTADVRICKYDSETEKWNVMFDGSNKSYSYSPENVCYLKNPKIIQHNDLRISANGRNLSNIKTIYEFANKRDNSLFWHICYNTGYASDYLKSDLEIEESCLNNDDTNRIFEYIKQISKLSELKNETTHEKLLPKKYEKITFVGEDTALAKYLCPKSNPSKILNTDELTIFPFGCNNSQYKAVKNALENQISIIQGPPGTGKTQTILNIISNILYRNQTVLVVSNNNAAIENVYEKLVDEKYQLGFLAAILGKKENKENFIENQNGNYPDFSKWLTFRDREGLRTQTQDTLIKSIEVFDKTEMKAELSQELSELKLEMKYFLEQSVSNTKSLEELTNKYKSLNSNKLMNLWIVFEQLNEEKRTLTVFKRILLFVRYGVFFSKKETSDISGLIRNIQLKYYQTKCEEINCKILEIDKYLDKINSNNELLDNLKNASLSLLRDRIAQKYWNNKNRRIFEISDLWKNSSEFLKEYPIILSTTFSSKDSLNDSIVYDYVIMDESSQVDIATGALALSCAKNAVIVGDKKQLSHIVKPDVAIEADKILHSINPGDEYSFKKSFLDSIEEILPDAPMELLREHYRCHPKIINYCNKMFYDNQLIIMTKDSGEKDVLEVIKSVKGNHARDHFSQRQIDMVTDIVKELNLMIAPSETGIIAPYVKQVAALSKEIEAIDIDTVHKFQGRECDNVIITTVDDQISDFVSDSNLINVAISRAKKKLILVTTGNEQKKDNNITILVDYIKYNNFEVKNSQICSVFDYLYSQYTEERKKYLKKHGTPSNFLSENLMNGALIEILSENRFRALNFYSQYSLKLLIPRDADFLSEAEIKYATNDWTRLDFLIYNIITKKPILGIEVDGYAYHREGSQQARRDDLKNTIMEKLGIQLLRFQTNGSREKEKIISALDEIIG